MKNNQIGLPKEKSEEMANMLNELLANYQVHYMNTRGFHWNIKGDNFFQLHEKFEELYNDALEKIDEIAERILTIENTPLHSYSKYLSISAIHEKTDITDGKLALKEIVDGYVTLLDLERKILNAAQDIDDEGTAALMSEYIAQQEKEIWMFNSYLG